MTAPTDHYRLWERLVENLKRDNPKLLGSWDLKTNPCVKIPGGMMESDTEGLPTALPMPAATPTERHANGQQGQGTVISPPWAFARTRFQNAPCTLLRWRRQLLGAVLVTSIKLTATWHRPEGRHQAARSRGHGTSLAGTDFHKIKS